MMTLRLRADSISCFFCCVFSLNFLVTTLVSQPYLRPNLVKTLLVFKNEFSICNDSVTSSWTEDTTSFDGVVFDGETGAVTELHLGDECLSGSLKANSSLFTFQHLRYLDLSFNDFSSSVPAELGRLINLDFLDLHHNGFAGEVPSSILNLNHLTSLDLSFNKLSGAFPPIHNLTELSDINLSYNNFSGTIPSYVFTMPLLLGLDVHQNRFRGPLNIPSSESPYMFESLNLGNNLFSGQILEPISNLVNLMHLDISFLNITFPSNFTFMPIQSLQYLDISGNNVSRLNISSDHAFPTTVIELHLSSCNIHEFPEVLKTLLNLQRLDISNNRVEGEVPGWLWNLPSLTAVRLSHNSIHGFQGSPDVLLSSSLLELDVSSNAFQGSFPIIPRSIEFMSASNNHFTGDIPATLCESKFLNVLDLSNNSFSGSIPKCFGESLQVLNLSNNNLRGEVPDIFYESGSLTTVDVGHNHLTGKLPRSLANCTGLEILNVESNRISDTFPFWLKALPNLQVIVLRANRFYGHISSHPLSFSQLRIIDISDNHFHGSLPPNYFANWSAPLISMPKGDDFPKYMVHLGYKLPNYFLRPEGARKNTHMLDIGWPSYFSMHLRNKGLNRELEKISVTYTAIDFSSNRLGGQIPESIGLLKSLIVLDLSNNNFTGHIPSSLSKLRKLESLDLSRNQLSGKIPQELGVLTFLGYIDMSYNKLSGQIPQSTQIVGQPKSSFEGNIDLCGLPLQGTCFRKDETPSPALLKQEEILSWEAVAIGYGPGVLVGLAIGQVIASFRPKWFITLFRL